MKRETCLGKLCLVRLSSRLSSGGAHRRRPGQAPAMHRSALVRKIVARVTTVSLSSGLCSPSLSLHAILLPFLDEVTPELIRKEDCRASVIHACGLGKAAGLAWLTVGDL